MEVRAAGLFRRGIFPADEQDATRRNREGGCGCGWRGGPETRLEEKKKKACAFPFGKYMYIPDLNLPVLGSAAFGWAAFCTGASWA
jgi:hypothetical protein